MSSFAFAALANITLLLVLLAASCFRSVVSLAPPDRKLKLKHATTSTTTSATTSRRDALLKLPLFYSSLLTPAVAAAISIIQSSSHPANALVGECKPKSHNCIRTQWTAPTYITTQMEAVKTLREVLDSYPQRGQAGVDCNG